MEPLLQQIPHASSWQHSRLMQGLTETQLEQVGTLMKRKKFKKGELILAEGEKGKRIYFIESGEVIVFKEDPRFELSRLGPGDSFGGMAVFNKLPRTASVKANQDSRLYYLNGKALKQLADGGMRSTYFNILQNFMAVQGNIMLSSDKQRIESIKRELRDAQEKIAFASFFTTLVLITSIYVFILRSGIDWIRTLEVSTYLTTALLAGAVLVLLLMIRQQKQSLSEYGVHTREWRKNLWEALNWTFLFMIGITVTKALIWLFVPSYRDQPFLAWPGFTGVSAMESILTIGLYCLFAPLQEFFARGVIQGTLQRFLPGRHVKARAILIATLLFSTTHLHLNTSFAVAVILPSIFWGILYARQDSLLGVSISHILIGVYTTFILGGLN